MGESMARWEWTALPNEGRLQEEGNQRSLGRKLLFSPSQLSGVSTVGEKDHTRMLLVPEK